MKMTYCQAFDPLHLVQDGQKQLLNWVAEARNTILT